MTRNTVLAFAVGVAVGSVATWQIVKKKYEQIAQEEIDSVKEVFSKRNHMEPAEKEEIAEKPEEPVVKETPLVQYSKFVDRAYGDAKGENRPYVIPPEEFGEKDGYSRISLMYYADHILTDDMDQLVENVEEIIGFESLTHFGEYEDDSVYVRNDVRKCDYEILRSLRTYAEVIEENPYKAEV